MYLEQNSDDSSMFSHIPLLIPSAIFYSIFGYYIVKFINYVQEQDDKYKEYRAYKKEEKTKKLNQHKKLIKTYKSQFQDYKIQLLNDVCLDTEIEIKKKQDILDTMLSKNTLERNLLIYYIFIKKGNYKVITKNNETNELSFEEYNSHLEFLALERQDLENPARKGDEESSFLEKSRTKKQDNSFLGKSRAKNDEENTINTRECEGLKPSQGSSREPSVPSQLKPSLDSSLEPNTSFFVGKKEYIINEGHLIMISWLYYSGLYDYVTKTIQIKYKTLKAMYNDHLLTSNLFLRYQFFLQENESLIAEIEKNEEYIETEDFSDSDELEDESENNTNTNANAEKIHKQIDIIDLDNVENSLETTNYFETDDSDSSESILAYDLDEIDLENELDEINLEDGDSNIEFNDKENTKIMDYFGTSFYEKYYAKCKKEVKNNVQL